MVKEIVTNEKFLKQRSQDVTIDDIHIAGDLRDTLAAHSSHCVGMTANMTGCDRACEREELISLAKTQMIVRIVQAPAYIVIFIAGSIGVITIFTIGISVALAVFDVLSIVVTGLSSVGVYALLGKSGMISQKERLMFSVAGFIYCFDVIAAIICHRQINERISA